MILGRSGIVNGIVCGTEDLDFLKEAKVSQPKPLSPGMQDKSLGDFIGQGLTRNGPERVPRSTEIVILIEAVAGNYM